MNNKIENFKKKIILVEKILKYMEDSVMKVRILEKKVDNKINKKELKEILKYLEDKNKIIIGYKGITWVYNNNKKLKKIISEGLEL